MTATFGDDQPWSHPSPGLWSMRKAEIATVTVIGALIGAASLGGAFGAGAALGGAAAVAVAGLSSTWFVRRRFVAWRYQERNEDLIVSRGVMFRRLSVVPYGRMQFVEVTAGPVERVFNLSTVKLHTAAAASDARIPGLHPEEAARLRDRLTELGESKAAGM
ncbi:MAG TPA: PH domain-containing protein [Acidimicrobiales bacterium]|nr:PH domain-containing protein [Acidimicrobiales bacterium]